MMWNLNSIGMYSSRNKSDNTRLPLMRRAFSFLETVFKYACAGRVYCVHTKGKQNLPRQKPRKR